MNRVSERRVIQPRRARHQDRALDADRVRSMADEGGCAGAAMDLRDQLAAAENAEPGRRRSGEVRLQQHLMWGVAGTVVGVLAAVCLERLRVARA